MRRGIGRERIPESRDVVRVNKVPGEGHVQETHGSQEAREGQNWFDNVVDDKLNGKRGGEGTGLEGW